ncbi:MAG: hypothetical protein ABSB42_05685 [Tepidisphaeraceae bacterium]
MGRTLLITETCDACWGCVGRARVGGNRRHAGAGMWDFLIFVSILVTALIAARIYFPSKVAVVAPPPVVIQNVPPPPVQEAAPAPEPAQVVAPSAPAPAPEARLKMVALPHAPPPAPACKIVERQLRVALEAASLAQGDAESARKTCLEELGRSREYLDAKADVQARNRAKDAAEEKLRRDNQAGADTDQDEKDVSGASQEWIAAAAKLTAMENEAIAADSTVAEKQKIAAATSADAQRMSRKLNDLVAGAIVQCVEGEDYTIKAVTLDTATWTINSEMASRKHAEAGVMADAAMRGIGKVLERAMCNASFTWETAKFTVFADYKGRQAVEFQARYRRSAVDKARFAGIDRGYFDDLALIDLADRVWLSPVVDEMQGRLTAETKGEPGAQPAAYREPADGTAAGQRFDTLLIGGYVREDGSTCPLTYVRRPHVEPETTSLTPIIPRRTPMPLYSKFPSPLISTHPPDLMWPPD